MTVTTKYEPSEFIIFFSPDYQKELKGMVAGITVEINTGVSITYEVVVPGGLRESGKHFISELCIKQRA